MPHQCLKCGNVFPTGSIEILNGCSQCGGKRFFYTAQPLSPDERSALVKQANRDIRELVRELLTKHDALGKGYEEGVKEIGEEWVRVKKGEEGEEVEISRGKLDELIKDVQVEEPKKHEREARPEPKPRRIEKPPARRPVLGKVEKPLPVERKEVEPERKMYPEVINIVEPGVYEIDLTRLLENSPIIVHKDGTYMIHLPSLFRGGNV